MGQEQPDTISDQVGRGEVAADQQRAEIDADFIICQRSVPARLKLDHVRDQIVLRRGAAGVHQFGEVSVERVAAFFHARCLFRRADGIQAEDHVFGPLAEIRQTVFIHAEDARDDEDRDRHGNLCHQVEDA